MTPEEVLSVFSTCAVIPATADRLAMNSIESGSGAMENDSNGSSSSGIHGIVVIPTDDNNLALAAIITIVLQLFVYLIACSFKFDYITDFAGGTNFVLLAAVSFGLSNVRVLNHKFFVNTDFSLLPATV